MAIGQGPVPMALGRFKFRGLGFSFEGQTKELETPWADLEVVGRMDSVHWMGPKSEHFSISGCIFEEAFGGQSSLDGIEAAAKVGKPLMLVTRAGRVHGMHIVLGVSQDRLLIRDDGLARKNAYEIQLRKYSSSGAFGSVVSLF